MRVSRYAKAIAAGVAACAASLGTALADNQITTGEGITAVLALLGGLGITYFIPNKPSSSGTGV